MRPISLDPSLQQGRLWWPLRVNSPSQRANSFVKSYKNLNKNNHVHSVFWTNYSGIPTTKGHPNFCWSKIRHETRRIGYCWPEANLKPPLIRYALLTRNTRNREATWDFFFPAPTRTKPNNNTAKLLSMSCTHSPPILQVGTSESVLSW